ncbi:putative disease resistance protein RGA3 [Dioscorea cayenensis subsp. rotundata]|uniref:Disease resistance protein RGA3 n=1 Tax=Dioscorea cayennensis subsp. rotundata TaxID=55577 RepID=A0AB40BNX6_DIOCR|nr:putative disease resistance protein RGA3 [Dioscorea cayenensis subsp. rotundata]
MSVNQKLTKDEHGKNVDPSLYRSMIGSLLYLTVSRLDMSFSVGVRIRYQATPKESHSKAIKRIIKYVHGTTEYGIWHSKDSNSHLAGYSDADWARNIDDRKSTSGGCFYLGAPKPQKLVEIGKRIAEKCGRLPLAIQVLGCIMCYKREESEWQAMLENIETWKFQHTKNKIMPELWQSYVDLPTHLKKCFAFCAIFPKDYNIEEVKLIQLWMAHGFIASQKGDNMEVKGREIFRELIKRSLLQNECFVHSSKKGSVCKMHDLIHDLAYFVMENECFPSLNISAGPEILISLCHLTFYADSYVDENYYQGDCSIIHTVRYCPGNLSVLSKLKLLRVLDLSYAYIDGLPASIEHLHHLRYLDISYTLIRKLPESIGMLVNLQTFTLYGCRELSELPKSITYMNNIRHLLFYCSTQLEAFPANLSQLPNLKTLLVHNVEDDVENNIRQLKSLNPFGELALYNLQKVKNADDARKADTEWDKLPPLEILPCLEHLRLLKMDGIKHIVNVREGNVPQSFPALKKLILDGMKNLEGWCVEEAGEANLYLLPGLIQIKITKYPKLTTTMTSIPTLQELHMDNSFCETQISGMSWERRFFKHLKSLRSLSIKYCTEELVLLLENEEDIRAMKSSLESLEIFYCNQLSLRLVLQNLPSLRDLQVKSLEKLVSWPDELQGMNSLNNLTISSCKKLTSISSQGDCGPPFLKCLWVFGYDALRELPMCPKSLQSLIITDCRVMESLWPEMGHLTSIHIRSV